MKKTYLLIVAVFAILASLGVIVYSLFHFRVINTGVTEKNYYIELDNAGSAGKAVGNTAVVSVFASDNSTRWDFSDDEDVARRKQFLGYIDVAADYIEKCADEWDKSISFFYAEDENSDLYYEAFFDIECVDMKMAIKKSAPVQWEYINNNIDVETIKEKYSCENVIFLMFINTEQGSEINSFALTTYDEEMAYPYEICFISRYYYDDPASPSVIAHEMLHVFGAPDLYAYDSYGINYNVWLDFISYCQENVPNDLMLTTFDKETGVRLTDKITNEISEITAYYIGWLDTAPAEIDEYRLVHSQHERKKD